MRILSRILCMILGPGALVALLAAGMILPASAQSQSVPRYGETNKEKTPSEIRAEKAAEKAYKRSLGSIPEQKSVDPWGTVRSDGAPPKASVKAATARPKSKSGGSKSAGAAKQ